MSFNAIAKGRQSEKEAALYLKQQGLQIIEMNYRCKGGEIDIIAQDRETLVFVEVKSRALSQFGSAIESITKTKQKRIIFAARYYLLKLRHRIPTCRFDAILIDGQALRWEKNCFYAE